MPPIIIACPQCAMQLRVPAMLTPGTKVKCPKCALTFETPSPDAAPLPPFGAFQPSQPAPLPPSYGAPLAPAAQPTAEYGPADEPPLRQPAWQPNDFDPLDEPRNDRRRSGIGDLSGTYAIDLSALFSQAQEHWSAIVAPMIAYMVLSSIVALVASAVLGRIPVLGPLVFGLMIYPQLEAGYVIVALAELKGRRWTFGAFWSGFHWFLSLMVLRLLALGCFLICVLPGALMGAAVANSDNGALGLLSGVLGLVGLLVFVYVGVRGFTFAVPLIVDRDCGAVAAVQGSWALTEGHFWGWFGVLVLAVLVLVAGLALCLVGVLFAAPFAVLLTTAGYVLATGSRRSELAPL